MISFYKIVPFIIVFVLHCNDVKISVVKLSELLLILYGFVFLPKMHNVSKVLFSVFTSFLIITLLHNTFLEFDYSVASSILQRPFWCSIGRYVELLCCLVFIEIVLRYAKFLGYKDACDKIFRVNYFASIFLIVLFILEYTHLFEGFDVITETGRLRGFFNEGGPFGLMTSLMIVLSFKFNRTRKEIFVLFICLLLSESKAGFLLIVIISFFTIWKQYSNKKKRRVLLFILLFPIITLVSYISYVLISQYSVFWTDADLSFQYAEANPDDYNFTAGRVSGFYIGYTMFRKNPFIGIGLGNYPVLRNLNEYRVFFPKVPLYDAMSFGGIADLLVQQGVLGLTLFMFVMYKRYKIREKSIYIPLLLIVFMCGVQFTFVYPWLLIALNEGDYFYKKHIELTKK